MLETLIPLSIFSVVLVVLLILGRLKRVRLEAEAERNVQDRRAVVNFLNRFAHSISTVDNIDNAVISLARYTSDAIHARSLCICLTDSDFKVLSARATIGPFPLISDFDTNDDYSDEEIKTKTFSVGKGFLGKIAKNKKPILITNADSALLANCNKGAKIHSMMAVPVVMERELKGLICAVNFEAGLTFNKADLDLLVSVSGHATLARNMIETYDHMGEQQRIHQELEFARTMQSSLMPRSNPDDIQNYEVFAHNKPAMEVSGDFYDFIRIDDNRMLLVVGDASGKGVPACMIMTMTRSILRSLCSRFTSLEEILLELNENIFKDTEPSRFMTLAFALLDEDKGTLECARAGHTELLLKNQDNVVIPVMPEGPAIGLLPNELGITFETFSLQFTNGYSLLFFTDGITEALSDADEEYGLPRLLDMWENTDLGGAEIVQAILDDVEEFSGDQPQFDDQTLMVITSKKVN
jgi:phosphoserine phosphatase RsbU/P